MAMLVSTRIFLENLTIRGCDWYNFSDAPVLTLHTFLSCWILSCKAELAGYRSAGSDIWRFFVMISFGRVFMINTRDQ